MCISVLTDDPKNEVVWKALPLINARIAQMEAEVKEAIGAVQPGEHYEEEDDEDEGEDGEGEDGDEDGDDDEDDEDDDEDDEDDEDGAVVTQEAADKAYAETVAKIAKATIDLEEANEFDGMPVFSEKDRALRDQVRNVVQSLVEDDSSTQAMR